jgi:hypothetical protein
MTCVLAAHVTIKFHDEKLNSSFFLSFTFRPFNSAVCIVGQMLGWSVKYKVDMELDIQKTVNCDIFLQ